MVFTVVSANGQVTIPNAVLEALVLKPGVLVSWELEDESVRLRLAPLNEQSLMRSVQAGLSDWSSDADEEAFADL